MDIPTVSWMGQSVPYFRASALFPLSAMLLSLVFSYSGVFLIYKLKKYFLKEALHNLPI